LRGGSGRRGRPRPRPAGARGARRRPRRPGAPRSQAALMERGYLMALGPSAIERKAMENEGSSSGGTPASAQPLVAPSPEASAARTRRYLTRRFVAVYAALGIVLIGSIVAFVVFALRPTISPAKAWSSWRPSSGRTPAVAKQIADHVAPKYRLAKGSQIV